MEHNNSTPAASWERGGGLKNKLKKREGGCMCVCVCVCVGGGGGLRGVIWRTILAHLQLVVGRGAGRRGGLKNKLKKKKREGGCVYGGGRGVYFIISS